MFPVDKISPLGKGLSSNDLYVKKNISQVDINQGFIEFQHIYLVSGDEIKKRDWYVALAKGRVISIELCDSEELAIEINKNKYKKSDKEVYKKIIACTDKSLNLPYLDLSKDTWIIDYYNKNRKLPDEIELESNGICCGKSGEERECGMCFIGFEPIIKNNSVITKQPIEKTYTKDDIKKAIIYGMNTKKIDWDMVDEFIKNL